MLTLLLALLGVPSPVLASEKDVVLEITLTGAQVAGRELKVRHGLSEVVGTTDARGHVDIEVPARTQVELFVDGYRAGTLTSPAPDYAAELQLAWPPVFTIRLVELDARGQVPLPSLRRGLGDQDVAIESVDASETRVLQTDGEGYARIDWLLPGQQLHVVLRPPLADPDEWERWPDPIEVEAGATQTLGFDHGYAKRLNGVVFAEGDDRLSRGSQAALDELARQLAPYVRDHPGVVAEVRSYTGEADDEAGNLSLSGLRAEVVRRYLVVHGVAPDQVTARGYGSAWPEGSVGPRARIELSFDDRQTR